MKGKKFLSFLVVGTAICFSVPHRVKAGSPAPTTTSGVRGKVQFQGKVPAAKPISMRLICFGSETQSTDPAP